MTIKDAAAHNPQPPAGLDAAWSVRVLSRIHEREEQDHRYGSQALTYHVYRWLKLHKKSDVICSGPLDAQLQQLRHVFQSLDRSDCGELRIADLLEAMKATGMDADAIRTIKQLDAHGSGILRFEELVQGLAQEAMSARELQQEQEAPSTWSVVLSLFAALYRRQQLIQATEEESLHPRARWKAFHNLFDNVAFPHRLLTYPEDVKECIEVPSATGWIMAHLLRHATDIPTSDLLPKAPARARHAFSRRRTRKGLSLGQIQLVEDVAVPSTTDEVPNVSPQGAGLGAEASFDANLDLNLPSFMSSTSDAGRPADAPRLKDVSVVVRPRLNQGDVTPATREAAEQFQLARRSIESQLATESRSAAPETSSEVSVVLHSVSPRRPSGFPTLRPHPAPRRQPSLRLEPLHSSTEAPMESVQEPTYFLSPIRPKRPADTARFKQLTKQLEGPLFGLQVEAARAARFHTPIKLPSQPRFTLPTPRTMPSVPSPRTVPQAPPVTEASSPARPARQGRLFTGPTSFYALPVLPGSDAAAQPLVPTSVCLPTVVGLPSPRTADRRTM